MSTAQEILKNKIIHGEISSFFDCLSDILLKYSNGELINAPDFKKHFSPYMLCRYLSMKTSLIKYAEYLNMLQTRLTAEQIFLLAYKLIPKQSSGFIKYLKKEKNNSGEISNEIINSNNVNSVLFEL